MADKLTVLLVDDHALVRKGFRRMLEDDAAILWSGRPATVGGCPARPGIETQKSWDGLPATGLMRYRRDTHAFAPRCPNAILLMLSMHSEDTLVRQALGSGSRAVYILKKRRGIGFGQRHQARFAEGHLVLDPQVIKPAALKGERDNALTPRELEILRHIVAGKSTKEIAGRAGLSANTVRRATAQFMDTLGIQQDGGTCRLRDSQRIGEPYLIAGNFCQARQVPGLFWPRFPLLAKCSAPGARFFALRMSPSTPHSVPAHSGAYGGSYFQKRRLGLRLFDYDADGWQTSC